MLRRRRHVMVGGSSRRRTVRFVGNVTVRRDEVYLRCNEDVERGNLQHCCLHWVPRVGDTGVCRDPSVNVIESLKDGECLLTIDQIA